MQVCACVCVCGHAFYPPSCMLALKACTCCDFFRLERCSGRALIHARGDAALLRGQQCIPDATRYSWFCLCCLLLGIPGILGMWIPELLGIWGLPGIPKLLM